jgi:tetratricopeptide (TPR) repeat protein
LPGYTLREAAKLLDVSEARIRAYVRAGFLTPERGARREMRFSFQDLVLLRTAKALSESHIPSRRVKRALEHLKAQIPSERPLSGVQIFAEGDRVIVQDGDTKWNPESGQALFNFDVAELARKVAPISKKLHEEAMSVEDEMRAEDWFALGCELEASAPSEARDAYRRALELDPGNADARVNLGRLLHEAGEVEAAEAHYRIAMEARPGDSTAAFNLGVALEDRERFEEAIQAYQIAIDAEPDCSDAYYNLAHIYEQLGKPALALRYLKTYKKLTER